MNELLASVAIMALAMAALTFRAPRRERRAVTSAGSADSLSHAPSRSGTVDDVEDCACGLPCQASDRAAASPSTRSSPR